MNTRLSLVQKLDAFMKDRNQLECLFTGDESVGVNDSAAFFEEVKRLYARGDVKYGKDVEGNVHVVKVQAVRGADLTPTPNLQNSDDASKAVQKTPNRVSLDSMKAKIEAVEYTHSELLPTLTICVILLQNGFSLVGKSAPADPENFDAALGRQFAYEDALRQMWPLEAYLLREQMSQG